MASEPHVSEGRVEIQSRSRQSRLYQESSMNHRTFLYSTALVLAAATVGLASVPGQAIAQAARVSAAGLLNMAEIERRAISEGIVVTEIELENRLAEVEGRDAQQRKVELVIDRKTGEVLQRKTKQRKILD
jgi:hypothetical protein